MSNPLEKPIQNMQAMLDSITPTIMPVIGTLAVNDSKENFRRQGFAGSPWAPRKKDKDPGRGILIGKGTGHLRNSIHIVSMIGNTVRIGTGNLPYARAHNEGVHETVFTRSRLGTNFPGHYTNMNLPKRQFMGMTTQLDWQIKTIIAEKKAEIFNIKP